MIQPKLKLIVITHSFYPVIGGVETFIEHLISRLDGGRYDIVIFSADKNLKKNRKHYKYKDISVHLIKTFTFCGIVFPVSIRDVLKLLKHLRKADVVHQHDIKFLSTFLSVLTFVYPFRLLLFSHGYMYHSERFHAIKNVFLKYFAKLSNRYTAIVNISSADYNIATRYNFRHSLYIREAINLHDFTQNPKQELRGSYLYFGRIVQNKGLHNLLDCLATIKDIDYTMSIVGNGDQSYVAQLKHRAQTLGIYGRLSWHHNVSKSELLRFISAAEVIFLPSLYEGFGISLLESIASRTRIIAQRNEAYTAMLSELGLSEFLFDFIDRNGFRDKLSNVLEVTMLPCKNLCLFDHDNMVSQIENAQSAQRKMTMPYDR